MISWLDHIKGMERLNHFGNALECLEEVEIFEVKLHRDGPRMEIKVNVSDGLRLEAKQFEGCNALIIHLGFYGVSNVSMQGWYTDNIARVKIDTLDQGCKVEMTCAQGSIMFDCVAARIVDLQAYLTEE